MLAPPREGNSAMSDPRQELLRQMAALRKSLDPKVVERLDLATEGKVPYDRETAQSAVRQFLATRHDGGRFQKKLVEALKKGVGKDLKV
jgi:cytochrome c biogenesis protein ResB